MNSVSCDLPGTACLLRTGERSFVHWLTSEDIFVACPSSRRRLAWMPGGETEPLRRMSWRRGTAPVLPRPCRLPAYVASPSCRTSLWATFGWPVFDRAPRYSAYDETGKGDADSMRRARTCRACAQRSRGEPWYARRARRCRRSCGICSRSLDTALEHHTWAASRAHRCGSTRRSPMTRLGGCCSLWNSNGWLRTLTQRSFYCSFARKVPSVRRRQPGYAPWRGAIRTHVGQRSEEWSKHRRLAQRSGATGLGGRPSCVHSSCVVAPMAQFAKRKHDSPRLPVDSPSLGTCASEQRGRCGERSRCAPCSECYPLVRVDIVQADSRRQCGP